MAGIMQQLGHRWALYDPSLNVTRTVCSAGVEPRGSFLRAVCTDRACPGRKTSAPESRALGLGPGSECDSGQVPFHLWASISPPE